MSPSPRRPGAPRAERVSASRAPSSAEGRAVLSAVLLGRSVAQAGLVGVTATLLRHRGFDVLDTIDIPEDDNAHPWLNDVDRPVPSPGTLLVVADLNPLPAGLLRSHVAPAKVNNDRLRTLPRIENVLRAGWKDLGGADAGEPPPENMLAWFGADRDGWPLIRQLVADREAKYREELVELEAWLAPPFPVVSELSEWGIAARTDLVEHESGLAVCKTFKRGREEAFQNELRCYALADRVELIPAPLETGSNWVLIPYLSDHDTLDGAYGSRIPVRLARTSVNQYQRISDLGIALLDFGPRNVLVGRDGHLTLIDFEHSFPYRDDCKRSLLETPLAMGDKFFETERRQLGPRRWLTEGYNVLKTYDRHWLPVTGIPLRDLAHGDVNVLAARQLAWFSRRAVTGRLRRFHPRPT